MADPQARRKLLPDETAGLDKAVHRNAADGAEQAAIDGRLTHASLEGLYREQSRQLVSQLARSTGCRDTALELAQEAFLRLVRMTPSGLASIGKPKAYLRSIARNLLAEWGRSSTPMEPDAAIVEESLDQVAVLESRETLRRLESALLALKPRTREIFLDHRIRGLTYAEIASTRGLGIKGVEKQMSKAIAKIDRMLDRG